MTRLSTVTASVLLGFCAAAASVHAGQISPDIVRPSAVVLDPRAYVSAFFQANTTEGETQLLQFYSYVPQWWSVWGQPVPLHFVIPAYFGDQFRYPYAAGSDPTKPIGFYVRLKIKIKNKIKNNLRNSSLVFVSSCRSLTK